MSEIATNRKAPRDYHILETYEAGLELRGTEVKSIRQGHMNLSDAFARVDYQYTGVYDRTNRLVAGSTRPGQWHQRAAMVHQEGRWVFDG